MADLNRIKIVLCEQKKTSKWLSEQMGVSACSVSKWCNQKAQPDLETINKIATVLGVDPRDLITGNKD